MKKIEPYSAIKQNFLQKCNTAILTELKRIKTEGQAPLCHAHHVKIIHRRTDTLARAPPWWWRGEHGEAAGRRGATMAL